VTLDEDTIFNLVLTGATDEQTATALQEILYSLRDAYVDGKTYTLVDLNNAGMPSQKARKIGQEMIAHERTGKIAFFGLHPVARVIASFIVGVSQKADLRFFKSREEALAWLKG
jgi:hypothetical protein